MLRQDGKGCGSNKSHIRLDFQVNCCAFFRLLSTNEKYLHAHRFESNKSSYIDHNTCISCQNETGKRLTTIDLRLWPSIRREQIVDRLVSSHSALAFSAQNRNMGGYLNSGENYGLRPLKLTRSTRLSEMHGRMLSDRVARFGLDAYNMYRYNSTLQNKITELMCTLLMFAHAQNE